MLYSINNYFNVQNSGSGISILTGLSSSLYSLTVNGNINADNIKFNLISGSYGEFFQASGVKYSGPKQLSGDVIVLNSIQTINLPPVSIVTTNFFANNFHANNITGINFTGETLVFPDEVRSKNFVVNNLMEAQRFFSYKEIELSGNLNIFNSTGKIEINKENPKNLQVIGDVELVQNPNFEGVSMQIYQNNFIFQDPDNKVAGYIYGNDTAGTINLTFPAKFKFEQDKSICRVIFKGNYPYQYSPSVVVNFLNKKNIFSLKESSERVFWAQNINNQGFDIAMNAYLIPSTFQTGDLQFIFNYLVIS